MEKKQRVYGFIKNQNLLVLSTVAQSGESESSVLMFAETDSLEIVFGTHTTSRKYKNLMNNQRVSVVIGAHGPESIQYEGVASELSDTQLSEYKKIYFDKNPDAKKWEELGGVAYFKITPQWIRYIDITKPPSDVFELSF